MKIRFSNKFLSFLGTRSFEIYLIHGCFWRYSEATGFIFKVIFYTPRQFLYYLLGCASLMYYPFKMISRKLRNTAFSCTAEQLSNRNLFGALPADIPKQRLPPALQKIMPPSIPVGSGPRNGFTCAPIKRAEGEKRSMPLSAAWNTTQLHMDPVLKKKPSLDTSQHRAEHHHSKNSRNRMSGSVVKTTGDHRCMP